MLAPFSSLLHLFPIFLAKVKEMRGGLILLHSMFTGEWTSKTIQVKWCCTECWIFMFPSFSHVFRIHVKMREMYQISTFADLKEQVLMFCNSDLAVCLSWFYWGWMLQMINFSTIFIPSWTYQKNELFVQMHIIYIIWSLNPETRYIYIIYNQDYNLDFDFAMNFWWLQSVLLCQLYPLGGI